MQTTSNLVRNSFETVLIEEPLTIYYPALLISCLLISLSRLSYAQLEQAKLETSFFKESLLSTP